jgi:hypothetical protein
MGKTIVTSVLVFASTGIANAAYVPTPKETRDVSFIERVYVKDAKTTEERVSISEDRKQFLLERLRQQRESLRTTRKVNDTLTADERLLVSCSRLIDAILTSKFN